MARKRKQATEDVVCSYCNPESGINESVDGDLTSWKQTEYGWKCIECQISDPDTETGSSGTAGIDGILGAVTKEITE